MTITPKIGEISHGTLRPRDLIETFLDELVRLCGASDCFPHELVTEAKNWVETYDDATDDTSALEAEEADPDEALELVNELSDALNELAPAYCYFGANEGDGASFGFWPDLDRLAADWHPSRITIPCVKDLADAPEMVAVVNDHGNVTLYAVKLEEVWSCV